MFVRPSLRHERDVHAQFVGGLSSRRRQRLLLRCATQPAVACDYQRYGELEQALCGCRGEPTEFALERMQGVVLAAVSSPVGSTAMRHVWQPWAFAGVVATAAAIMLLVSLLPAGPQSDRAALPAGALLTQVELTEPLRARGGGESQHAQSGIRILRVTTDRAQVQAAAALAPSDWITFTYTNVEPGLAYLAVCGIQADGKIRWYYPDYGGTQSVPILTDVVDEPLGDGIDLVVHHQPGPLQILAVFSRTPLAVEVVAAEARRLIEVPLASEPLTLEQGAFGSVVEHWHSVMIAADGDRP